MAEINWGSYEPYVPLKPGLHRSLTRADAKREFENLINSRTERRVQLQTLLDLSGVTLGPDDADIEGIDAWFVSNVSGSSSEADRLDDRWYGVVRDIALYLGDVAIQRHPRLRWEMYTGHKNDVAFQRHVLTGSPRTPSPTYNVDIDRLLATYGHRMIAGEPRQPGYLVRLMRAIGENTEH